MPTPPGSAHAGRDPGCDLGIPSGQERRARSRGAYYNPDRGGSLATRKRCGMTPSRTSAIAISGPIPNPLRRIGRVKWRRTPRGRADNETASAVGDPIPCVGCLRLPAAQPLGAIRMGGLGLPTGRPVDLRSPKLFFESGHVPAMYRHCSAILSACSLITESLVRSASCRRG